MCRTFVWLALFLTVIAAWWAYSPGLSGGFLFDDFNNLNQLGAYGRVDNLRSLFLYLTSGSADPLGRPLSLLTFLLDARDWPADPASFKRTNLLLHLINGALLAWVLVRLGHRIGLKKQKAQAAAMLGAALWILHPFFVSTTLYIVQREAMLPATFTLLGMLFWLEGSDRLAIGRGHSLPYLITGAWGCTILAMLCKANGVLIPLLLLSLEWTIPADGSGDLDPGHFSRFRRVRAVLLGAPCAVLATWLVTKVPSVFSGDTYSRPWTIGQRLLSEPRVICDYLDLLWLPQASGASVFNDGFHASSNWLHPWTTLPALLAVAVLLGLGFKLRLRHPAISFAIVFFFAGHVLESTLIPLELYFEHRNYLPALPMFWPLAIWLTGEGPVRVARITLSVALPVILAVLCHARADVWGKPYEQAMLLAKIDADSPRAQANAAAYEIAHGRPDLAAGRLQAASRLMPDEVQIALNWLAAECMEGSVTTAARDAAHFALAHNRGDAMMVQNWLVKAIETASQNQCQGLDLSEIETMLRIIRSNPNFSSGLGPSADLIQLQGRLALAHGDGAEALLTFNRGLAIFPTPDNALLQAALLGGAGFPSFGLEHLQYFKTLQPTNRGARGMPAIHLLLLERWGYWDGEFAHMEKQLNQDASTGNQPTLSKGIP